MLSLPLSASEVLALRLALGHTITAYPSPTLDFPFTSESTEKLTALLDSALSAVAPSAGFTLNLELTRATNDNSSQQLGDKDQYSACGQSQVSASSCNVKRWQLTFASSPLVVEVRRRTQTSGPRVHQPFATRVQHPH